MMNYSIYMQRCLDLARLGEYYVAPNPMVGAVLVRDEDEQILAEGWHRCYGGPHAEVNCFAAAPQQSDYSQCTLFVNLEPCSHYGKTPPCAQLLIEKRIGRVVVGMQDPNPQVAGRGIQMLRQAGIEVIVGVEETACRALNKRFICLHEQQRPYVILKWAQTADGYIDHLRNTISDGAPLVISTAVTKQLVHQMRAENMAIMVGTRTVLLDNPRLLTTHWSGRNPIRVVLDRHGVLPPDSRVFSHDAETIRYQQTDWTYILHDLAARGIHSILVEGGAQVLQSILASGVWDEIHIEVAPIRIGQGVAAPQVGLPSEYTMMDGHKMYLIRNIAH